ncbi:hypothetical protein OCO_31100 [Mycobacterium intracellulare MOTT-02]|uniref:Uncharacterized protein n=1 Tax=Mycobacterium intracellulare (strain ATCC 13950 / DSM 43223 / JCM 6384 / NCTC 13025 / 3600) TaxID=487521 RepID=H8IS79_MYCIA|nr:hypothetical protein OCU_30980 [Mycobacterium intracellulare ATCC 13950]AFC49473.1 hypothetical protein OCO_31100 [Mycobacterium intracellulare MOTT-02]AFC54684.1 hypothetical protein OCQ_31720 [Mycobacterium paraintracellulare]
MPMRFVALSLKRSLFSIFVAGQTVFFATRCGASRTCFTSSSVISCLLGKLVGPSGDRS